MIAKYMEQYIKELIELLEDDGETKEDIDEACRYAENLLALNLPVIFDGVHLALLMGIDFDEYDKMLDSIESHYHTACIPKKSGKYRELDIPSIKLRAIQRWILKNILEKIKISEYATGFCINKSIVTNAKKHVNKNCVINIDLEDFFPSIKYDQVFNVFYYYGYTTLVSYYMANTCTFKGHLPQGAPTSPYISNIVCLKLDKRLSALAKSFGADYTRYADDITFSGNSDISAVIPIVERLTIKSQVGNGIY